jgi:hypothetical protein
MARACSSNSFCHWVIMVTMPVSCGRGLTSLNQTWSPLTNSSTPNRPSPPRLPSVTLAEVVGHRPGNVLGALQRHRRHGMGLPAFHIVAMTWMWPIGSQKWVVIRPSPRAGAHGQQRDLVVEVDEAFDDHPAHG